MRTASACALGGEFIGYNCNKNTSYALKPLQKGWASFMLNGYNRREGKDCVQSHSTNWRMTVGKNSAAHHDLPTWEFIRIRAMNRCGRRHRHTICFQGYNCKKPSCDYLHAIPEGDPLPPNRRPQGASASSQL